MRKTYNFFLESKILLNIDFNKFLVEKAGKGDKMEGVLIGFFVLCFITLATSFAGMYVFMR